MRSIVSTKVLNDSQRSLVALDNYNLMEYNAIKISPVPFIVPNKIENIIFTSQNSVKAVMDAMPEDTKKGIENCFCVGSKTKKLLEDYGLEVKYMTDYGVQLAEYLVKNHNTKAYHFFCGNLRREVIPTAMKENNISLYETEVYKTTLDPVKLESDFDAILFYSPSGVNSFMELNHLEEKQKQKYIAVCIGTTTEKAAQKYFNNVVISDFTTVESVVEKAIEILS